MRRIQFISYYPLDWVVSLLRCTQPAKNINGSGLVQSHCVWNGAPALNIDADIVVLYRLELNLQTLCLLFILKLTGRRVFYATDDLTFSRTGISNTLSTVRWLYQEGRVAGRALMIRWCDGLIVSTPYLGEQGALLNQNIYLLRNRIPHFFAKAAECKPHVGDEQLLGYFSGSKSHNQDFALIAGALVDILREFPAAKLLLVGFIEIDSQLDEFSERIEHIDFVGLERLPQLFSRVTLALAPLTLNAFSYAKSEIKITEPAYCRVVTLASKIPAYQEVAEQAQVDILVENNRQAWYLKIKQYLVDDVRRKATEARLFHYVSTAYSDQAQAAEWVKFVQSVELADKALPARPLFAFYQVFHRCYVRLFCLIRDCLRTGQRAG